MTVKDLKLKGSRAQVAEPANCECPLCSDSRLSDYFKDARRGYLQCECCNLVSVPASYHLDRHAEKSEYDQHQNDPQDSGYRRFLARTLTPLLARLSPGAHGLDFGCGPGPTLSVMAAEQGFTVDNYDIYYFNQPELLSRQYDFICMTEVIEHLAHPMDVLQQLDACLKPGGWLAIMTKRVRDKTAFAGWHYKNDPTHIAFYSLETFTWISEKMAWRLEVIDNDVVFFYKE